MPQATKVFSSRSAVLLVGTVALVATLCSCSSSKSKTAASSSAASSGASSSGAAAGAFNPDVKKCDDPASVTKKITGTFTYGWSAATSGPLASAVGLVLQGIQDRFDVENAKGGIDGVKLKMDIKDDAYTPDKAKANGTQLLQSDHVDAIAAFGGGQLGAMIDDQNAACVPALLAQSSDPTQRVIANYPWTIVALPASNAETAADVQYLKGKYPSGVKVGIAENQTASGKGLSASFQAAAKGTNLNIVSIAPLTDPNGAVTTLKAAGAQVIYNAGVTTDCLAFSNALARVGFKPELVINPSNCVDGSTLYKPAGAGADGTLVPVWLKDPSAALYANDKGVVDYLAAEKAAGNKSPLNSYTVNGWVVGDIVVNILQNASKSSTGLTRLSIIQAARNQNYAPPMYINGINWVSTATKFVGVGGFQLMKWDATSSTFSPQGTPIDITPFIQ